MHKRHQKDSYSLNHPVMHSMIRVNHAGEYGAVRIYEGQLLALKLKRASQESVNVFKKMCDEEKTHLSLFHAYIVEHRVSPTVFQPLWHLGGHCLGFFTGLMSEKLAHACTFAVEEIIDQHYRTQLNTLQTPQNHIDSGLLKLEEDIEYCRQDEEMHKNYALHQDVETLPFFSFFRSVVQTITKTAISLSKRF